MLMGSFAETVHLSMWPRTADLSSSIVDLIPVIQASSFILLDLFIEELQRSQLVLLLADRSTYHGKAGCCVSDRTRSATEPLTDVASDLLKGLSLIVREGGAK